MFEVLTEKISKVLRNIGSKGKLSEKDIDEALRELRLALLEADVNFKVVKSFLAELKTKALDANVLESLTPGQHIVKIVNEELTNLLGRGQSGLVPSKQPPSVIMLVGLQGAGKTTTAAKLASFLKQAGQRSLLVAADTRRPAAIDQLIVLGKQLDIPVYSEGFTAKPQAICRGALKQARELAVSWVIIDTQGRLHIDEDLMKELVELKGIADPSETLLVADAMTGQDAVKVAEEFNGKVGITGLILTKMDGDARGGCALSIRSVTGVPIKFMGVGEKTTALELFYPDRLASRILGMGDILTLIEKTEKAFDEQQVKRFERKIRASEFTLDDFLEQLNQLKKMGPLNQLLEMIPGFTKLPANLTDNAGEKQMKKTEAIILSMTPEERSNPSIINGSRRKRIAMGSGTMPSDVNQLLNQFIQIQKLTKSMAKGKMPNMMNLLRR
jgi:signal recognition particle subunit SRP54